MKDSVSKINTDPYLLLEQALATGWQSVDTIPVAGEGEFIVLTIKGLVRRVRNRNPLRNARRADVWGPKRTSVIAVETGNYLGAIAWKWPQD